MKELPEQDAPTPDPPEFADVDGGIKAWRERAGPRVWEAILERGRQGDHATLHEIATAFSLFGVRPGSAEAKYVSDRLRGRLSRGRGKPRYRTTAQRDSAMRRDYAIELASMQELRAADRKAYTKEHHTSPPSQVALATVARKYNVEEATAYKIIHTRVTK